MLHLSLRRAVAGVAVAGVTATVAIAAPAGAQPTTGPDSPDSPVEVAGGEAVVVPEAARGHRVRLRVRNQDVRGVRTTRTWARRLAADEQVRVDRNDLVRVRRDGRVVRGSDKRRLRDGDAVQVVAVDRVVRTRRTSVDAPTRTRTVSRLRPGQREVVAKGRDGVRKVTIVKTRHNRRVVDVDRTQRLVREPRPRRVLVGASARTVPGTGHLNWRALAECESSGNPRAVNPAGYYGLYQFDTGTWRSVGGSGVPSNASASEQTYRAQLLYRQRGRSPWPHCGRYL